MSRVQSMPEKDPKMNKDTAQREKRDERLLKVRKCFWLAIVILLILCILSIIVLVARISDHIAAASREVSLNSEIHKADVDIFDVKYKNVHGEIVVHGMDGDKVVAPGTDVEYTIRVRNTDRIAIDYELLFDMEFYSEHAIPLRVRVLDNNDDYILGSAKEWVDVTELRGMAHRGTIMRGECVEYVFQWMWPFEGVDDAYDTFLGNMSEEVGIRVFFTANAAANITVEGNGGLVPSGCAKNIAIFLFALLLLLAIILLIISIIKKFLEEEPTPEPTPEPEPEPTPIIIFTPTPEPEPEPEPVVIPVVAPEDKVDRKEGFYGKMAYINVDTLQKYFNSGDVITLSLLKKAGLIHPAAKQMKILARNSHELDKAFTVKTQGISAEAKKIIKDAGGVVIITKG